MHITMSHGLRSGGGAGWWRLRFGVPLAALLVLFGQVPEAGAQQALRFEVSGQYHLYTTQSVGNLNATLPAATGGVPLTTDTTMVQYEYELAGRGRDDLSDRNDMDEKIPDVGGLGVRFNPSTRLLDGVSGATRTPDLPGVFTLVYEVTDAAGNFASLDIVLHVCETGSATQGDGTQVCNAPVFEPIVIDLPEDTTLARNAPISTWTFPFLTYTESNGNTVEGGGTGGTGTWHARAFHILESGSLDSRGRFQADSALDLPDGLTCGRLGATHACDARDSANSQNRHRTAFRAPVLMGTPTETGTWLMRYSVTDKASSVSSTEGSRVTRTFNLVVAEGLVFGPGAQIDDDTHSYALGTAITNATLAPAASSVGGITYRLTGPSDEAVGNGVTTGLSFDADTRILSGTPTVAGTVRLTYSATDASGAEVQQDFRLVVAGPQLAAVATLTYSIGTAITATASTDALPAATGVGTLTPVTYSLADSDGQTVDEAIPGLSFDAATRIISGTPVTAAGTVVLTYTATDSNNNVGELVFSVVLAGPRLPTLAGQVWSAGTAVSVTLDEAVVAGTTTAYARPLTYSLAGPDGAAVEEAVPGVRFDPNTRILSGTPTTPGFVWLTYTATDDLDNTVTGNFSVNVSGPTFLGRSPFTLVPAFPAGAAITPTALYAATQSDGTTAYGAAVTYTLSQAVTNADVSEAVPGLRFDQNTRMLSGTPTTPGLYQFVYSATDIYGNPAQTIGRRGLVTYYYIITVTGPQLAAEADRSGSAGSEFTATTLSEASGSTAEVVTYSLTGPEGPDGEPEPVEDAVPGLVFDPVTRELSGTPTMTGTTRLTYRVEDTVGNGDTEFFGFTVTGPTLSQQGTGGVMTSGGAGLTLTPAILTTATQTVTTTAYGTALEYSLAGPDGEPVEEAVPGMVFVPATRELSGTSTVVGTTTLTYTATDSYGNTGMTVFDLVVPGVTLPALPGGITGDPPAVSYTVGTAITALTFARPGTGVFRPEAQTMRLSGGVPDGLEFDPVSGVLSGTPAVAGTTTLTWEVTDLYGNTATSAFTVTVTGIVLAEFQNVQVFVGTPIPTDSSSTHYASYQLPAATGYAGSLADVVYGISALPPGVSLNLDPSDTANFLRLTGTPTTNSPDGRPTTNWPGGRTVNEVYYTATDALGNTATETFSLVTLGMTLSLPGAASSSRQFVLGAAASSLEVNAANNRGPGATARSVDQTTGMATLTYAMTGSEDKNGNRAPLAEVVPGLTFDGATRRFGGTPLRTGTFDMLYTVTDDYGNRITRPFTVTVTGGSLALSQDDLPWMIGETVSATTLAAGTPAGSTTDLAISSYTLRDSAGNNVDATDNAVPGLVFDPATRELSGTLTVAGTTTLTYTATDASGNVVTDSVTVTVSGPTLTAPGAITDTVDGGAITAVTLPEASDVGGSLVVTYDVTGDRETPLGEAVPGLTFDAAAATRSLSGTPTVTGTTTLTYSASVSTAAGTSTGTQTFTVTLSGLTLPDPSDLTEVVGTAITDVTLEAATPASTLTPLTYAVTGPDGTSLGEAVPGLSFAPTTRVLSGTPLRTGTTTLSYTVTDGGGNVSSQEFTATVTGRVALDALTTATRTFPVGVALSTGVELRAATGATMVTYAVEDPADPTVVVDGTADSAVPGLSLNVATSPPRLSGTPTEPGTYPLIYSATDGNGNRATTALTVVVDGLALAAPANQTGTLGTAFTSITLSAVTRGTATLTAATDTVTYTLRDSAGMDVDATDNAVPGLTFDSDSTSSTFLELSGTPSAAGGVTVLTYSATVAPCAASCTATTTFSVTVAEPALDSVLADMTYVAGAASTTITLPALGNVDSGVTVSYTLQDAAGMDVDTTDNAVPGLTFDSDSTSSTFRELSGTPTSANGLFSLTYTATTETSTTVPVAYTDMQIFTLTVVGGPTLAVVDDQTYPLGGAITALTLSAAGSASGFTGVAYTLRDSAGLNVDATATTGNAVPGLTFTPSTRILTGTPTTPGATALTYEVTAGDYSVARTFTVTVTGPTLSTDDRSFPAGSAIAGSATLTTLDAATGIDSGLDSAVTYTLRDSDGNDVDATGNAVPGLTFMSTGRVLSGTPTTPGATVLTYTAAITATTDVTVATTGTTTLTFTVTGPALGPLTLATRTYPVGVAASSGTDGVQLAVATEVNDLTMVTYAVADADGTAVDGTGTENSAVPGLSFNADAGSRTLGGTPTAAGTYPLIYSATDEFGNRATTPLTVVVPGLSFGTGTVADQVYTQDAVGTATTLPEVTASSSTFTPVTYAVTGPNEAELGTAVPGLAFAATTRTLSGTPTASGTVQLTYTATDSMGNEASQEFRVTVNPPVTFDPSIDPPADRTYAMGEAIPGMTLPFASGGTGTVTYALTGPNGTDLSEVDGLTFTAAAATRALSGTPTETGTTLLTYTATDDQSSVATSSFTVTVVNAARLAAGPDDQIYVTGEAISTLTLPVASGGTGDVTYALTPLPTGLSFDSDSTSATFRQLSGTPTAAGTTVLTYTATQGTDVDTLNFTVTVTGAPVFRAGQVDRSYSVGEAVSLILPAAAGSATPTYTLAPLPDGLIFDSVPRRLHGRPTAPGTTELVYTATTAGGAATLTFSVTVSGLAFASTQADQNVSVGEPLGGLPSGIVLPEASGVSGSVTYALTGPGAMALGTAVPGLSFDATATTRRLQGTPTVLGTTVLTYTATDAYGNTAVQTFRVAVAGTAFEDTVADQFYPVGVEIPLEERLELPELQTSGTGTLDYTLMRGVSNVDATDNAVPGLVFDAATRVLSGTPTVTGTTVLTYAVTGTGITTGTVTPLTFSVVVTGGPAFLVDTIPDQEHASGAQIPAVQLPEAAGGSGALTYKLTGVDAAEEIDADGNAMTEVPGLRFDPASRQMSGTMGAATVLTYTVTDAGGNTSSLTFALLRLPVSGGFVDTVSDQTYPVARNADDTTTRTSEDLPISSLTLPEARLDVEDEDATVTYSLTGPNGTDLTEVGLDFAPLSRVLSGIPVRLRGGSDDKTYLLTYTATDGDSNVVGVLNFRIRLVPRLRIPNFAELFPATYPAGREIIPVEFPEATGETYGTLVYSLISANSFPGSPIPYGLVFDPSTRTLSGTPLESDQAFAIRYRVCDTGITSASGSCVVSDPFDITIAPSPYFDDVVEDTTYAVGAAAGATALTLPQALPAGPAYEYDLYPLPGGLRFHAGGRTTTTDMKSNALFGTPTTTGTTVLTYTATHPDTLAVAVLTFTVVVVEGPVFSSEVGNQGFAKDAAITSLTLPAADYGGSETLAYTLRDSAGMDVDTTDNAVAGLSFDAATRVLSGTPTENGVTGLTYTAVEGGGDMLPATQVFTVVVRDAGQNARPQQASDVSRTVRGDPGSTVEVDLSVYFMDPDGDPLSYSSCVLVRDASGSEACAAAANAAPLVSVVRQDGPMLTLYFGLRSHSGSDSTRVRVTARDVFDGSARQILAAVSDRAPVRINQFVDVTLRADSGETTYVEAGGNFLNSHFRNSDIELGSEAYRFSASSADETVAGVRLGTEDLATNTSLTLIPRCVGTTEITVGAEDVGGRSSAPGTFTVTVVAPDGVAPACGDDADAEAVAEAVAEALAEVNEMALPEVTRAIALQVVDAIAHRIDLGRVGRAPAGTIGEETSLASALAAHGEAVQEGTRSLEELLGGSNFALSLGGGDGEGGGSSTTLWGSGSYASLSDESGDINYDGDLLGINLGADTWLREDVLVGLMVSRSRSDLEYEYESAIIQNGDQKLTATSLSPYVGWSALDGGMDLWASLSFGTGHLDMSYGEDGSGQASSDVGMRTLAAGLSGRVMEFESGGALRVKGDAFHATMELDGSSDGVIIRKDSYDASRLRVSAEASLSRTTDSGARLEPSVEAGIRHDGGDGSTGSGIELRAGLLHTQPSSGVTLEGGLYTLVGRDDYKEWGVDGQIRIAAGTAGRGLSFNLSPSYGKTPSGLQKIWQRDAIEGDSNARDAGMRVDARLGYGLPALGGRGLLTPYSEITFEENNTYRLGVKWDAGSILRLDLAGETGGSSDEDEVLLKVEVLF